MLAAEMETKGSVQIKSAYDLKDKIGLIDEVLRVEEEAWPEEIRAPKEKFECRLKVFPEGFLLAYLDGKLAGVSTSEVFAFDAATPPLSWEEVTDNGFIEKTHTPGGNAIYVVSVGVSDWAQGKKIGSKLLEAQKDLVRKMGLKYLVLGSRLPGYRDYHLENRDISAEEYANTANESGEPLDAEVRFYSRNSLSVHRVVPNYMEDDPESENFGVVMVWENR